MVPEGISELETARKLLEYHRNIIRILPAYPKILKVISADQPCMDVFYQGKYTGGGFPGTLAVRDPPVLGSLNVAVMPGTRMCWRPWESSPGRPRFPGLITFYDGRGQQI